MVKKITPSRLEKGEGLIASVLLEEGVMKSEVAADMVALKIRQRLNAHGYGKLPQPLDGKELKEKALSILEAWQDAGTDYIISDSFLGVVNEIYFALLQPKMEEARRQEREKRTHRVCPHY